MATIQTETGFPRDFDTEIIAVPHDIGNIGNAAATQLASRGLEVRTGLTPDILPLIQDMSKQPHITEFCPLDRTERFGTDETASGWLEKGRAMFVLARAAGQGSLQLAGYGWTGSRKINDVPEGETTFAIRIGQHERGTGLAVPFGQVIIAASARLYDAGDYWLQVWDSNYRARRTYAALGFEETAGPRLYPRDVLQGRGQPELKRFMAIPRHRFGQL